MTDKNSPSFGAAGLVPEGAQAAINGLFYKVGIHGKAFYHTNGCWVRSERSAEDVKHMAEVRPLAVSVDSRGCHQ